MNVRMQVWTHATAAGTILLLLVSVPAQLEAKEPHQRGMMGGMGQPPGSPGDSRANTSDQTATGDSQQTADAQLVTALKSAHRLLLQANQDYAGHRTLAAQNVREALVALGYRSNRKTTSANSTANAATANTTKAAAAKAAAKAHTTKSGATKNGAKMAAESAQLGAQETQATPGAKMLQAKLILVRALSQMDGSRPKAVPNVKAAIAEINAALAIQ
jgi:hypothetical protein